MQSKVEKRCFMSNISLLAVGMSRIGSEDIMRPVFIDHVSGLDSLQSLRRAATTYTFSLAAGRSSAHRAETATSSARGLGNAPVPYNICVSPRLIMRFRAATPMWTKAT